jgi:hypothetical protein
MHKEVRQALDIRAVNSKFSRWQGRTRNLGRVWKKNG